MKLGKKANPCCPQWALSGTRNLSICKARPDLCFKIRLNSIIYSVFCVFFQYYSLNWIITVNMKQVGLLPSTWGCSAVGPIEWWKVARGQRIGVSISVTVRVFHRFIWRADHTGIICLPAIPYTPHAPLFFSLCPLSTTHTQLLQKSNWKNWGLWKWAKPGLLEAPMPQCILKHHCVADAVPPACRSSNFNGHIISNDNKAQESFRPKCRTSRVFHTRWMRLPRRRHSVSLSARVTDRCQNTGAQFCSPSRERDWEGFSFYLLIIIIPPFLLLQTHSN